jgi:hypothetical protein
MNNLDFNIFGDKKLKDLFQEIYTNQKKKERQISTLIEELKPMVESIGDATLIVPLLKEYLEIGVKNDEQLIKMATVIQRCLNNSSGGGDGLGISEAEKSQLLSDINKLNDNSKE